MLTGYVKTLYKVHFSKETMDATLEKEMIKKAKYDAEKSESLLEKLRHLCLARGVR